MRARLLLGIGLIVAVSPVQTKQGHSFVSHFVSALRERVSAATDTRYQHKTDIDFASGRLHCDCSGFLGFVLKKNFPDAYSSLDGSEAPWRKRPLAVTFYETFVRAGRENVEGWSRINKITDVRVGDFIAWRKDEIVRGESTGHVLMVVSQPQLVPGGRAKIRVLDSTSRIHADDTRNPDGDGAGEGTMWFEFDANYAPVAYYVDDGSERGKSTLIAIGRLDDKTVGENYGSTLQQNLEEMLVF